VRAISNADDLVSVANPCTSCASGRWL